MSVPTNAAMQDQLRQRISDINTELANLAGLVDSSESGTSFNVSSTRSTLLAERTQCFDDLQRLDSGKVVTRYSRAV